MAPSESHLTRLERAGIAGATLFGLGLFWTMLCTAPAIPWNVARLAPSFALARGLPVYVLRDSGAQLGWVYGPVMPLWFLPAGLTDNPTLGIMIAVVLNAVALVVPPWLVLRTALAPRRDFACLVTVFAVVLLLANPVTNIAFYIVHVDGLCVGWALLAATALHARVQRGWKPGFPLAAAALALSVATKQVSVVLVPATLAWLWHEGHARLIGAWLFWLASVCGIMAVACFAAFGAEELLFNAWLLFSRMPWRGGWGQLGANLSELAGDCWLWAAAGVLIGLILRAQRLRPSASAASLARLLGWIGLIQVPLGLTASLLVDAGLNSIHAPVYFLIAGLVVAGSSLVEAERAPGTASRRLRLALGVLLVVGLGATVRLMRYRELHWTPHRGQEELLAIVRRSPGKVYLPWNPLVTLIADRKVYPFDEALRYLWMAKLEPPRAAIKAAVPAGAFILYQEPSQSHFALNYFGRDTRDPAVDR